MRLNKVMSGPSSKRGELLRERVIDAAERLLREGNPDFSMRELAAEAGVSFATPFNQFGSKSAIMHALSARRIDAMISRFESAPSVGTAIDRVIRAVETAAAVMLEEARVNRAVMGWLGSAAPSSGTVLAQSASLWKRALGDGEGLAASRREAALRDLPDQLAFGFRGVLSFWTAGELPDDALAVRASDLARSLLRGFVDPHLDHKLGTSPLDVGQRRD